MLLSVLSHSQDNPHKRVALECEVCHNSAEWRLVSFDHDKTRFQLEDLRRNNNCADCHITPGHYDDFSSINACHSQRSTDGHHDEAGCYSYGS